MDLIDRYVYDVGRRLPLKQREDIEKELKSLLLDALEARTEGREPGGDDIAAVLKEFGQPSDVAARYLGEQYVIGPQLYHTYKMVLGIVLGALTLGLALSTFLTYLFDPAFGSGLAGRLFQFLASLVSSVWGAIGIITVIFWGIGRGMAHKGVGKPGGEEPWDPKTLPVVPKHKNAWRPADSIAAIVFIILALILFNAMPEYAAMYMKDSAGQWQIYQMISPDALAAYLPLWNIGWALSLALHGVLLAQGRWGLGTNLAHIALQLYGIAVAGIMLAGPPLFAINTAMAGNVTLPDLFHSVVPILQLQFIWIYIVIMIVSAVEAGKGIYRIIRDRS